MNLEPALVLNNRCKYFLVRKNRFCRMVVKDKHQYCGEHQPPTAEALPHSRIVCPLDSSHTCYIYKLKHHLKICNARKDENTIPPYIQYGVNKEDEEKAETENSRSLRSVDLENISALIAKVEKIHSEIGDGISDVRVNHDILEAELGKPEYGNDTRRHLLQTSSLLGLLEKYNLLKPRSCFIEFGGGKGKLSYWLSEATKNLCNTGVLLVDKASHRHKRDNKCGEHVVRIKADIRDLVLNRVDVVATSENVVGVAKHLCGSATDLALKCMESLENVRGLVFAFCCHHRCHWGSYTGKAFFKTVGLTRDDFDAMCGLVSWATCGHAEENKVEIGKKCKTILDWGRLLYLREHGFQCALHHYVPSEVSLENVCVVGYKY